MVKMYTKYDANLNNKIKDIIPQKLSTVFEKLKFIKLYDMRIVLYKSYSLQIFV